MSADLTVSEAERLDACEQVIERGLATFVDVGTALLEVRDSRLYRMTYPTFEAYCEARWNMARNYANKLVTAAQVVNGLGTNVPILPANEAQARELSGLAPDEQRAVWAEAVATAPGGKVTAVHVRAVARISEALSAAPEPVREVVERFGVADADTISELTRLHKQKAETFAEVAASGWIQPGDEEAAVRIDAGALKVREALRDKAQTHRLLAADERVYGVPPALQMSESNEWYTPARYIEAAREVMGSIDLDPASNATANQTVKAARYFTQDEDGLAFDWHGNVWMNPPYGRESGESNQGVWSARLIEQYRIGNVTAAVMLVNAVTDRAWFAPLWNFPICFTDHRIRFYDEQGEAGSPTHGNALVYLGKHREWFAEKFHQFGPVVMQVVRDAADF